MKKRKVAKRSAKSKNVLIIVALGIVATITTALFSSFLIHINAKEKITITEFSLSYGSNPGGITAGPDGNIWFTEISSNKIGRITPDGIITEFQVPSNPNPLYNSASPLGITSGPDGNLWFTEHLAKKIGRITPDGVITEFVIPTNDVYPMYITGGPDGNIWFTEGGINKIGRITLGGEITEFSIPTPLSQPISISTGSDGNIWFTETGANKIGRITPNGTITEFPIPTSNSFPQGITAGPDGNIWFTEYATDKIGRITPDGIISEFSLPTKDSAPQGITAGPDGNLWFTEHTANKIGRITSNGTVTEFSIPTSNSGPNDITTGSDGNIWFTENIGKIGRVNVSDQHGPDRDFALLSPFNNGVTWNVSSGYFNNRSQTSTGCHVGTGPDHCRNQLFGLDMVPDQQDDRDILAPVNGTVGFKGRLEENENCLGLRIILDNGLNLNVCHFASFNVSKGERVVRGKVLGTRSSLHVHLSLDDRYRIGTLCPGQERCFLPIPFDGQHTIEGVSFDPNPNGETVLLPYPLCDERKVDCQFEVDFQQYKDTTGTSTNVVIP